MENLTHALQPSPGHVDALLERGEDRNCDEGFQSSACRLQEDYCTSAEERGGFPKEGQGKRFFKRPQRALEDLAVAIKLQPDFAIVHYDRVLMKIMAKKDSKGAKGDLSRAGELGLSIAFHAIRQLGAG